MLKRIKLKIEIRPLSSLPPELRHNDCAICGADARVTYAGNAVVCVYVDQFGEIYCAACADPRNIACG